jgi:hypothetical protein
LSATTGFSAETEKVHMPMFSIGFVVKIEWSVMKKGEPYSENVSFISASSVNNSYNSGTSGFERQCWTKPRLETAV